MHVDGPVFVDADGKTVALRGVAVHTLDPVTYQQAPALGVNFVRLAITWSDYEPTAPVDGVHHWDQARLSELDAEIAFFNAHGIQVLLDLHQYGWSPYFAALQRGGRANGIPQWVYHGRRFPLTVAGREQAQAAMYTDRRATQLYSDFAAMLAQRYRETPNVVGYEILNEPPLGNLPRRTWAIQRIVRWQARGRRRRPRGRPGARDRVHAAAAHRRAGRAADPARAPGHDRPRRARLLRRYRHALPHHPPGRYLPGHPRQPGAATWRRRYRSPAPGASR